MLNNDAFLTEGVVEKLLAQIIHHEVGAVGPAFRYPDGWLQEMGGFVASDGHGCLSIFNGHTWDTPSVLDVDYISAACLLVRRTDFLAAGGFAPEFTHAYFEDTDLCLRLRSMGKKTRLVKSAVVYHIHGATYKRAEFETERIKANGRNLNTMRSRWGRWLVTRDASDAPKTATFDASLAAKSD